MKIVAFTTDDELYLQHARLLEASLKKLNLELHLEVISADDWQKIIAFKPSFIRDMLKRFKQPILYIDADAFVHSDMTNYFADVTEDIAAHYYLDNEFTSGTLFINDSPESVKLIDDWVETMALNPTLWDQKVLQTLVEERIKEGQLTLKKLSPEFTYIFDRTPQNYPNVGAAIIEHLQASREARFAKQWHQSSSLKRVLMKQTWLNKQYKRLKYRRYYANQLAKKVNLELDFNALI